MTGCCFTLICFDAVKLFELFFLEISSIGKSRFGDDNPFPLYVSGNMLMVNVKWWWAAMLGGSILLAVPGV